MHIAMQLPPSYELTESVTPAHTSITAARKTQIGSAPRVKLHPVKSTPVTHSGPRKPYRIRIQRPKNRDEPVRKQLFPVTTPRKRKAHERPAIKVNCGRERTQPFNNTIRRDTDGTLTSSLRDCVSQAEQRIHDFRIAVEANRVPDRLVENALLLRIQEMQEDLFVVEHISTDPHEILKIAVLASKEIISERGHVKVSDESFIYVPQPWHAHDLRASEPSTFDFLIVPYRASLVHTRNTQQVQGLHSASHALDTLLKKDVPTFEIPDTQEEEQHKQPSAVDAEDTFSQISPHTTMVNLYVYIDVCSIQQNFAIVRDIVGEFALLVANLNDGWPAEKEQRHYIRNAHVMAKRVKLKDILDIPGFIPHGYRLKLLKSRFEALLAFSTRNPT